MDHQERIGYVVGYTAAFVVDKFAKVSAVRYTYKTQDNWVGSSKNQDSYSTS